MIPINYGVITEPITQDQGAITPNKTNLLGETKTKVTRTPKGTITTNTKGGPTTKIFKRISLLLFVVSMFIILTIAPKLLTSSG
jgi:hypothetical protein